MYVDIITICTVYIYIVFFFFFGGGVGLQF